ncbi:hypothetical protein [uncultured Martelella sp.]|uniref:hypothetical protein n=1 Tax=uncultured Martelella sp. TaxID=392331 RepID=UPI0029C9183B|nr:hypothetical protein [uncultured Martelella sp.]
MAEIVKSAAEKTFKREAATFLMLWFMALTSWGFFTGTEDMRKYILGMLIIPIPTIFAGAYGLDWIGKKTHWGGPPENARPGKPKAAEGEGA